MISATILALLSSSAPDSAREPAPIRPLAALVSDTDYPAAAIRREASGTVAFVLDVDAAGTPTRCAVTGHADPLLDQTTCDIAMARARFRPARDDRGRAVAGRFEGRIRWVLPALNETAPFMAMRVTSIIARDAAGDLACSISLNAADRVSRPVEACGFLAGSGAAEALRQSAAPADVIADYVMIPAGAASVPGAAPGASELVYEDVARLVVTPDGNVAACRGSGPRTIRAVPGLRGFAPACPRQGMRFDAAPAGTSPREAEIALRVYFRPAT
jgi:hypothetical protein